MSDVDVDWAEELVGVGLERVEGRRRRRRERLRRRVLGRRSRILGEVWRWELDRG